MSAQVKVGSILVSTKINQIIDVYSRQTVGGTDDLDANGGIIGDIPQAIAAAEANIAVTAASGHIAAVKLVGSKISADPRRSLSQVKNDGTAITDIGRLSAGGELQ